MAWHLNLLKDEVASHLSAAEAGVEETLKVADFHQRPEIQQEAGAQAAGGPASLTGQCGGQVVVCCLLVWLDFGRLC